MVEGNGSASGAAAGRDGARVLVVDDEIPIATMLRRALERAGITAETAHSGREALERLQGARFEAVVCDLRMPDVSGQQLHAALSHSAPEMARRMLFLTGDVSSEDVVTFLERSGCRYVAKPFELRQVIGIVSEMLAGG